MTLGDRLQVMHKGKPVQLATPMEAFETPSNTYVDRLRSARSGGADRNARRQTLHNWIFMPQP